VKNGTRKVAGVTYQRYLCRPNNSDAAHTLKSYASGSATPEPTPYSPPERCPKHPLSRTVRDGKTKRARGVERQRYRCYPNNGDAEHRFTPVLSRLVVDHGETCPECSRERGVNQGDTNVAHGYKFTTRVVAAALAELADGDSYGSTAVWAKQQMLALTGHTSTRITSSSREKSRQRKNSWRLAADWVETFSPVLFEPWAAAARAEVDEAFAQPTKDRQVVSLLLDDIPVFVKARQGTRQRQRFSVLAASESFIDLDKGQRVTRLRLLRAYPDHSGDAYKLVLAELGYVPDIVMADGGTGIGAAVRWLEKSNPGKPFAVCLSAYHLRQQLRRQLAKLSSEHNFRPGDLEDRLQNWSFSSSSVAWHTWWGDYENRMRAQKIAPSAWPHKWINEVKPRVDAQMPVLDQSRVLPRSTGSLEATLFDIVKPTMNVRGPGFGNLERTNRLLDLMTLRANGVFDNLQTVANALVTDALLHDGFAPPVRSIADVRMVRSLLDETMTERLVKQAGL
jgi:hypothetical protein